MNTLKKMFSNKSDQFFLAWFLFMTLWFIVINTLGFERTIYNYLYSLFLAMLPLFGGVIGLYRMKQWGGHRSKMGKVILFLTLGTLSWSVGSFIWVFYNFFLGIEAPYPSFADIGYSQIYIYWAIGFVLLSNLVTLKIGAKQQLRKIYTLCIPITMMIVTYFFIFIQLHNGLISFQDNPAKTFVDMYYPLGDIVMLTIIIISFGVDLNYLGARLRLPITLFIGSMIACYIADFYFSYSTTVGNYYDGSFSDYLFTFAMFIISLGLSNLHPKLLKD